MQGCLSSVLGISEGKALAHDKIFRALFGRKIQLLVPESSVLDEGTMFHTPELPYFEERPVISHDSNGNLSLHLSSLNSKIKFTELAELRIML